MHDILPAAELLAIGWSWWTAYFASAPFHFCEITIE
jgi:hypothetical protein